jgi:hypothetical protein
MSDGVRMIGIGCLKKLLEVISGLPRLAFEVVLHGGDELLVGVTDFLVVIPLIIAGSDCDSLGPPLLLPLVAFGAPLCALAGCVRLCPSITIESHLLTVLEEDGPDRLPTRGMPGGDVEELLHDLWLVMTKLMHQGLAVHAGLEYRDDVGVTNLGELMALLGGTPDVIPQGFTLLLPATLQIPRVAGPHVGALEVSGEDLLKILPAIDRVSGQVIEPRPSRVS